MRRYQMWLAAGVLALGPGLTLAGPLSFLKPARKPAPKPRQEVVVRAQNPNDEKARDVARAIRRAQVGGKVQVAYQKGVAVLMGPVKSAQEAQMVLRAADSVEGVQRIENRLQIPSEAQQADAVNTQRRAALQRAGFQPEGTEPPPAPMTEAPPMPPGPGPMSAGPAPMPYAPTPTGMPSHHVYDQPNMPGYAWPSYAAYPNSAAVNYPQQYSASAWPYIGPFYPYPQVPLGWRKVELEWDDGYWQLNFRPRTARWWWFLDYKNW